MHARGASEPRSYCTSDMTLYSGVCDTGAECATPHSSVVLHILPGTSPVDPSGGVTSSVDAATTCRAAEAPHSPEEFCDALCCVKVSSCVVALRSDACNAQAVARAG